MKRKIAILLLTALITISVFSTGVLAFAETSVSIDNSYVLDDLDGAIIGGETFDADNYDYSEEKEPSILSFAEYGYSFDKTTVADYSLYLYVYNPSGREIRDTALNRVSIATYYENGVAVDYDHFTLKLINCSTDKYAYLFYKFKINDTDKIWTRVSATTNKRRYDVGEIELNYGASNSVSYTVGNYYEYSGFAKGYGADSKTDSTLSCISDTIQTVQLEVTHANYVYNNGDNVKTNLHNVYFGVPSDLFIDYGTLQQIKLNYFLTYTGTQYYVFNKSYYDFLKKYIAFDGSRIPVSSFKDSDGKTPKSIAGWTGGMAGLTSLPGASGQSGELPWWFDYGTGKYDSLQSLSSDNLRWLFYLDKDSDYYVSSNSVMEYAQDYTEKYSKVLAGAPNNADELLLDKYLSHLFIDLSKYSKDFKWEGYENLHFGWQGEDGKGIVIDADSKFTVSGGFVPDRKSFWDALLGRNPGSYVEPLVDLDPIYLVKDSDLTGSNEEIAERLHIAESEVSTFRQNYTKNKLQGKKTVLLRYLATPYLIDDMTASMSSLVSKRIGYTVQQAVALNFDLIWLKFITAEGKETVIPVVASPTDGFTGFNPFEDLSDDDLLELILKILGLILGLVFVIVLLVLTWPFWKLLFKGLWWLISAPFKAIGKAVRSVKNKKKK